MTRFWLRIEAGVEFVCSSLGRMRGGEIFVPRCPSASVSDVAEAVAPGVAVVETGIRPGEKLHESLISEIEARQAVSIEGGYIIEPEADWYEQNIDGQNARGESRRRVEGGYGSDTNPWQLNAEEIRSFVLSDPAVAAQDRGGGRVGRNGAAALR
jgi:UDP-N-acetylglucosamine 4,6-dehydratase